MGKIKKTPSDRHTATISPEVSEYVNDIAAAPLHQISAKLAGFPLYWPYPRGDLYHWIPLLDRFDHILELFNKEYGLNLGPQTQRFGRRLLEKGDQEQSKASPTAKELDEAGYSDDGDRELIEQVLVFTRILLERCGNRSLYASSGHINDLLHTTSLSLLQACLRLSLRLAQRYQVARYKNNHPQAQSVLLANHYNINFENMHKIALPFPKPQNVAPLSLSSTSRPKDKTPDVNFNPSDLVSLAKDELPASTKRDLAAVTVTHGDSPPATSRPTTSHVAADVSPLTPTPVRRTSSILGPARDRPSTAESSSSMNEAKVSPSKPRESDLAPTTSETYQISATTVEETATHVLVQEALPHVPKESQYDLLHRIRVAKAFSSPDDSIRQLLNVRLLAISNLAYSLGEQKFQEKIGNPDAEEPRRFHLSQQLCDLLQPTANGQSLLPLDMEVTVVETIEALVKCKQKSSEAVDALAISVNHGVLYYELRRAVASLRVDIDPNKDGELLRSQWRNAVFDLITTVSQINHAARYADKMVAAGIIDILVEVLTLRTTSAERLYEKIIGFLSSFIHGISAAFQSLTNARGLEIMTELASFQVSTAMQKVRSGSGMPEKSKSKVVDYDIPYYQQATLRSLFKFIVYLFDHRSGVHDRLLRNLLDSPQMLGALRTVIGNAPAFGSNVWDAAINTVSNFIHNEPTSFQVIAEAGLARGILEAVTQKSLPDNIPSAEEIETERHDSLDPDQLQIVDGNIQYPDVRGILPVGETICDIPTAFGALCLNEDGMKLFQASGALHTYFNIFVSQTHVRALEEEGATAFSIGNAFDELSRHHPQLKEQISTAVLRMVKRVRSLTRLFVTQSSAKLWSPSSADDKIEVDGGRASLLARAGTDTQMSDDTKISATSTGEDVSDRAPAAPYLNACFKFLEGFFNNSSMCQNFCRSGGGEVVLDIVTSPANPYDLVSWPVYGKIVAVVQRMCDENPHLILPSLLLRAQESVRVLKTFADSSSASSCLEGFTDFSKPRADLGISGTKLVRSLANVHALSQILGRILAVPTSYGSRNSHTNQLLINLNFTDVYVQLIDDIGKLDAACLWESLALQKRVPEKWKQHSNPDLFSDRRVNANGVVEPRPGLVSHGSSDSARPSLKEAIGERPLDIFAFKNTRALRFLLAQTPLGIESFFQSLGQVLTSKRNVDAQHKQHAALIAEHLAKAAINELSYRRFGETDKATEYRYVVTVLNALSRMLLRSATTMESFGAKEAVTLVLLRFFQAGGFDKLNEYLHDFAEALRRSRETGESVDSVTREGLTGILSFFAQVTRSKCINEATQSSAIAVRDVDRADYFMPSQFLVELRYTILKSIDKLWHSTSIIGMESHHIKMMIEILRSILKAEGEDNRPIRRSDNATRRVAASKPEFKLRNSSNIHNVEKAGFDRILAMEAIYRCNNHEAHAIEYCDLRLNHAVPRIPVPETVVDPLYHSAPSTQRQTSVEMADAQEQTGERQEPAQAPQVSQENPDADHSTSEDENLGSLGSLPADLAPQDLEAMASIIRNAGLVSPPSSSLPAPIPTKDTKQPFTTVDDLNDERNKLCEDLIDRCLEMLSAQPSITFELADLIQAAVAKSGEGANPRADIGKTLVSSLLSLQGEEESRETGVKISAYAHLVALILQDRDFFDSTLDELKDYFASLVTWIQLRPDQKAEDAPWIEMLLLIIERVMAEDEQPVELEWIPPPADNPLKPLLSSKIPEPVVSDELRSTLFDALLDILPKVGKNTSLALSISRVLVILTRRRSLSTRLSDKHCMSRLFLMIRQLASPIGPRLQSSFMLVLRHMVEDEMTLRQIMRTEIRGAFDGVRGALHPMDTNAYVRDMYHLVLRDPDLFVEVTQEMLEISRHDGHPQRAQQLSLRKTPAERFDIKAQAESSEETKVPDGDADMSKAAESKPAAVEMTDGVIQFLLRELSNFKEVEDKPPQPQPPSQSPAANRLAAGSAPEDIEMSEASTSNGAVAETKKSEKPVFKPDEHVIYVYRCFLMQCLAELLACYTRTKLEFINFSRKSENLPSTPSKPRSGTLNYLLNILLPVGTLEHREDIAHRKKVATSDWATTVLVALVSQTLEKPFHDRHVTKDRTADAEDPDLTFVRRFVLEHALRSFKEALASAEPLDMRYSRMMALADLFDRMLDSKQERTSPINTANFERSQQQFGRLMYERNFIAALTSSIAELDLNFSNAKRAVKHILMPLKTLTDLAVDLSQRGDLSSSGPGTSTDEDEISSATSVSDDEEGEEREQTPDLFRNSTLSMFEASGSHDDESESEDDEDDDQEMYDGGYDEEMDYEDDNGETVSDEDEEIEGMEGMEDMGDIEGMPGDVQMEVEIMGDDDEDDDDDDEDDDEDDEDENDEDDEEDENDYLEVMEEITGDDENASLADAEEDEVWEDDGGFAHANVVDDGGSPHGGPLEHLAHVLGEDERSDTGEQDGVMGLDLGAGDREYFEDEMPPEDDDEDDDEGDYDGDVVYEPELEEDEDEDASWDFDIAAPHGAHLRQNHPHHHNHRGGLEDILNRVGETALRPPQPMRFHRNNARPRGEDEGTNPLLQREGSAAGDRHRDSLGDMARALPPFRRPGVGRPPDAALFQEFITAMDRHGFPPGALGRFTLTMEAGFPGFPGLPGRQQAQFIDIDPNRPWREQVGMPFGQDVPMSNARGTSTDEAQAVEFKPAHTVARWQEEARLLFGSKYLEKATRIIHTLLRLLVPPAMEAKRIRDKEEAERKAAEEKAREEEKTKVEAEKAEREAKEKKEREEREAREAEEAAAHAIEQAEAAARGDADESAMEGIEQGQPSTTEAGADMTQEEQTPAERVTATIRGREVDITNLGIDRTYLEALPEELREEVIMAQFASQRSQAQQSGEAPTEISREFLEALPPEIQQELLRSEALERRRREQSEANRRTTETGNTAPPAQAQDMEAADFLAMLDPQLRQQVLMDAHEDENYLSTLPEDVQREARALLGERRPHGLLRRAAHGNHARIVNVNARDQRADEIIDRNRPRPVVQMLDKAGVATLLRLMFVSLHHRAKSALHVILSDVCKNTQNRAEVISILLSILQDGTADVGAVERSFAQLSLRAKQLSGPKTPQPLKRTLTGQMITPVTELSPLNIVQQCLTTLNALSNDNPKVQTFFLSEHETITSQKAKAAKKGKNKDSKATKYPLNALLMLLDRKLITENTGVMETLAALLSRVTGPLQALHRKAKEAQEAETKEAADVTTPHLSDQGETIAPGDAEQQSSSSADVPMQEAPAEAGLGQDAVERGAASSSAAGTGEQGTKPGTQPEKKKRTVRAFDPPEVPEENIRLIVNILAARECPSQTFRDTCDIIKHVTAIPGAWEVFGRELSLQAQELSSSVVTDLEVLAKQINSAESGTDVQGMALASFSSAGSKQRKLLRVLLALDYLFDPKRILQNVNSTVDSKLKDDILLPLYESETFLKLWKNLSLCLGAIRRKGHMVNVATILLPLIESLMVVCRNNSIKDVQNPAQAEVAVSTPPPETRMEGLFFTFTEEHRKILNELIRNNPKLMNGNLSVLAKNSKVLEFDNKRNYFTRKLHNRGTEVRVPHPSLTLNVRRNQVFMDSYKALYYKSGDEIKNGKLNIRFNGEEGIDAGGVSREWFAVMARQMFNPDFALFNPVASDRTTFHPNSLSNINPEHLSFFKFIGRVIGKALYEGRVLDCHFSRAVYRRILGKSVSLKDMETLDLDYYKSLVWILENDITDITFETFSIEVDRFGVTETVDLIPDGRNVPVTEDNKQEYVRLVVEHRLIKSVEEQLEWFLKGFHDIIPAELVSIFNEQELELLISGLPEIDVDDWRNNTEYHNYQATSAQIQWFWRAVKSFDPEERAKLLQFVTGTSKVPLNGFKELEGMNGFAKFNIHRDYSSKEKLPTSHTCFNRESQPCLRRSVILNTDFSFPELDLPEYESYEHLRQQMYTAITAGSEYFGFA